MVIRKRKTSNWKIWLLVFVVLIILIAVKGAIRFSFFEGHSIEATAEQMDSARGLVSNALQSKGDSISNYDVKVSEKIRRSEEEKDRSTLQVFYPIILRCILT